MLTAYCEGMLFRLKGWHNASLYSHHFGNNICNLFLFYCDAGLCGFFPVHPRSYMYAWRSRKNEEVQAAAEAAKSEELKKE
jgi:hypothetical protein